MIINVTRIKTVTTEVLTIGLSVGDWAEIKGCYVHALAQKEGEKG